MLTINKDNITGTAKVKDIQNQGIIKASINNIAKEQAIRRIRTYSGIELKGKELFDQLDLEYVKEERRVWK